MHHQLTPARVGQASESGDVRSRNGWLDRNGVQRLAGRESRCYGSEYSGSQTKQALSRYKVLTGAITMAQKSVSTQDAGPVLGMRGDAYSVSGLVVVGVADKSVDWCRRAVGVKPVHPRLRNDGK
jgi:hypothetical protein